LVEDAKIDDAQDDAKVDDAKVDDADTDKIDVDDKTPAKKKQTAQERIDEIYGKMKTMERDLTQSQEEKAIIKTHHDDLQELMAKVDGLEDKVADTKQRPDPVDDPDGYDAWILDKAERKLKQVKAEDKKEDILPAKKDSSKEMEFAMAAVHDDYYQVIADVNKAMASNPALEKEFWATPNPYQAAYKWWKKKEKQAKGERDDLIDQGDIEGSTTTVAEDKDAPTADQKHAAKVLGISIEKYMKQVKAIDEGKDRT